MGVVTATGADINGDIDVDGHTNLDNVSIAGVTTVTNIQIDNSSGSGISFKKMSQNTTVLRSYAWYPRWCHKYGWKN